MGAASSFVERVSSRREGLPSFRIAALERAKGVRREDETIRGLILERSEV